MVCKQKREYCEQDMHRRHSGFSDSVYDGVKQVQWDDLLSKVFFKLKNKIKLNFVKDPLQKKDKIHECSCSLCKRQTLNYSWLKEQE